VGAILGAPLLLSTFAMFLIALTTIVRRKPNGELRPEHSGLRRDLNFFLIAFAVATIMLFLPTAHTEYRYFVGGGLVALYFVYILFTVRASSKLVEAGHQTEAGGKMYAAYARLPVNILTIILQTLFGLAVLVAGAEGFIHGIETISHQLGISALLLSLIIAPFATELPEKVNSVLWIRRNRDTLAFGNVTGAMVFQGSLLPAMGIMTTPWAAEPTTIASAVATLIAAFWLRLLLLGGHLKVWHLLMNGMLYMAYLIVVLWGG
jgi:cation:H+ antiporter